MRQRLNRWNQLNAQRRRVVIHRAILLLGVAAAKVTEIRVLLDFVGVLGVELNLVIAHFGQCPCHTLKSRHIQHAVSGTIQHNPQRIIHRLFGERQRRTVPRSLAQQGEAACQFI